MSGYSKTRLCHTCRRPRTMCGNTADESGGCAEWKEMNLSTDYTCDNCDNLKAQLAEAVSKGEQLCSSYGTALIELADKGKKLESLTAQIYVMLDRPESSERYQWAEREIRKILETPTCKT